MNLIRSFIAIDFPPSVRQTITEFIQAGKKSFAKLPVRWVTENNYNLTLRYLGEIPQTQLDDIRGRLAPIASQSAPFPFQIVGRGLFPDSRRPSVLWIGAESSEPLQILARTVMEAADGAGIASDHKGFKPHLTIARVQRDHETADLSKIAPIFLNLPLPGFTPFMVDHYTLYKSELLPAGPRYSIIESFPLTGGV